MKYLVNVRVVGQRKSTKQVVLCGKDGNPWACISDIVLHLSAPSTSMYCPYNIFPHMMFFGCRPTGLRIEIMGIYIATLWWLFIFVRVINVASDLRVSDGRIFSKILTKEPTNNITQLQTQPFWTYLYFRVLLFNCTKMYR
jgi:hypothetical protein